MSKIDPPARRDVTFAEEEKNWGSEFHVKATWRSPDGEEVFKGASWCAVRDYLPSERRSRMRRDCENTAYAALLGAVDGRNDAEYLRSLNDQPNT